MFAPKDLSQIINPWSWWFGGTSDNQVGLVNITQYRSNDTSVEKRIVSDVAGYGMQLDVIEETLEVLIAALAKHPFNEVEQQTLEHFQDMMASIRKAKQQQALENLANGQLEQFLSNLASLKEQDPALFQQAASRIQAALDI